MDNFLKEIVVIVSGFITLAIISVLVSKNANTPNVLSSFFSGVGSTIGAATAPVSGVTGNFGISGGASPSFNNANFGGFN